MSASGIDLSCRDEAIRPQDDFFGHANGAWLERTAIPEDKSRYGGLSLLTDEVKDDLLTLLAELRGGMPSDFPTEPEWEHARKIVVALFDGYLNVERLNERGLSPISPLLEGLRVPSTLSELWTYLGELSRIGVPSSCGVYVTPNPHRPTHYAVLLYQGGLGLPDEAYYRDEAHAEIREAYLGHIERMFTMAGQAEATQAAFTVMEVETALAKHHLDNVTVRDADRANRTVLSFDELTARTPTIPWKAWMDGAEVPLGQIDTIGVLQPEFIDGLENLVAELSLEQWRTWALWKILAAYAPYLSEEFDAEAFAFNGTILTGAPAQLPRERRALDLITSLVPDALARFYVTRHFTPEAKARMDELVSNLVAAYRERLSDLPWMTPETRTKAQEKLAAFVPKIGYPAEWKPYASISLDDADVVTIIRQAKACEFERQVQRIGQPVDKTEWLMPAHAVNAYYMSTANEIVFPAGILRTPMFSLDADDAVNYGAIGAVIGHEIGHGFDDQGSKYDGTGQYNNWWTDADRTAFEALAQQLIQQFDQESPRQLPALRINGAMTVGENIGDLTGLSIGYFAYQLSLQGQEPPVIDGLTGPQRFFLGWAQVWRVKYRDEFMKFMVASDVHSPSEHRVNIVRNLTEFYDAFEVTEGDGMWLPEDRRVRIW